MQVKLDNIIFSSMHEAYKNYASPSDNIAISGSVADGATSNFSVSVPYTRGGTRADIYLKGNNKKIWANQGSALATGGPYQYVSTENADVLIEYTSSSIDVTITIFNGTGAPINLTAQTIEVTVVQYDAPITAI